MISLESQKSRSYFFEFIVNRDICVMLNQNSQKSKKKVICLSDNFLKTFVFNPIFIKISLFWTNFWLPFFGLIPAVILKERKTIVVTQQTHLR